MYIGALLKTAVRIAERAGALLLKNFRGVRRIGFKRGEGNLVTDMDHASEELIVRALRRAFPDHAIVAEERGASGDSPFRWHIDPLDATANYAHGFPHWCVSIGPEDRIGVVYNPNGPEMFAAEAGRGAWRNGRRIHVSRQSRLDRAFLATGFSYHPAAKRRNLDYFARFLTRAGAIRRAGSAALDLSYVAAGVFDGFWEFGLGTWDLAAAVVIAREAGARVTAFDGGPFVLRTGEALATNGRLHAAMIATLARRLPTGGTRAACR